MKRKITLKIPQREAKIGASSVRRLLPYSQKRMIGPFIFLDHMGPEKISSASPGVLPHPHIGLSTVTYLFSGEFLHQDSTGAKQVIRPGDVNWMNAGNGVVHSERFPAHARQDGLVLEGLQIWVALPKNRESMEPSFQHYPAAAIPAWEEDGIHYTLIAGEFAGKKSPVQTESPLFYLEVSADQEIEALFSTPDYELGLYCWKGSVKINGELVQNELALLSNGTELVLEMSADAHFVILGGAPFVEKRYIWWNFVSSTRDLIVAAKERWKKQEFPKISGDSQEFVAAPDTEIPQ